MRRSTDGTCAVDAIAQPPQLPVRFRFVLPWIPVLSAAAVRFWGLARESIWLDEATSIIIARMDLRSVIAWAAGDIHPPLYYLVLHAWLRLGDSEFAVRSLSAVCGIVTVGIAVFLACELFGPRAGLLAGLLLALSPLHIWYSQEARMYAMVTMWSLLSSCCMLLALRRNRAWYFIGWVTASAAALYTHYFALFVLAFQALFAVGSLLHRRASAVIWFRWLLAAAAVILLFSPWVPVLYHQATTGGGGWVERSVGSPAPRALLETWINYSIGLRGQLYPTWMRRLAYALFAASVLFALGGLFSPKRRGAVAFCLLYVLVPLLVVWLFSQVKPMYTARYLLPFLPPYGILVASGIDGIPWTWVRASLALALGAVLLVGVWEASRTLFNPDWRGASRYVLSHSAPGDVALFSPRWNVKPFDYYTHGDVDINMDLPIPVTAQAAEETVSDVAERYSRVWLFWERGHYSDPRGLAREILDRGFRVLDRQDFRGVGSVQLYDLAAPHEGG